MLHKHRSRVLIMVRLYRSKLGTWLTSISQKPRLEPGNILVLLDGVSRQFDTKR